MKKAKILVVDDDPDILEFLSYNLKKEGYEVTTVNNGLLAVEKALEMKPELILLDVMMPKMDGIETCEKIRENPLLDHSIIAFLTARGEDYSQIAGFQAGGDDYITKPIKPKVLISRIKALLKRASKESRNTQKSELIQMGDIYIDKEKYLIIKDEKEYFLPKKEFELLLLLSSKPGKVYSRDDIFSAIWGDDIVVGDRTIDVHVRKLREKIGNKHIKTVKGVGYKFEE